MMRIRDACQHIAVITGFSEAAVSYQFRRAREAGAIVTSGARGINADPLPLPDFKVLLRHVMLANESRGGDRGEFSAVGWDSLLLPGHKLQLIRSGPIRVEVYLIVAENCRAWTEITDLWNGASINDGH